MVEAEEELEATPAYFLKMMMMKKKILKMI